MLNDSPHRMTRSRARTAMAAVLLWLAAWVPCAPAADPTMERIEKVFASPEAFAACFRDGAIDVTTEPGCVLLAPSEGVAHEIGNHFAKETLPAQGAARVRFDLGQAGARKAEVYVFGQPGKAQWNGSDLTFRYLDGIGWSVADVKGTLLRDGTNEIRFPAGTTLTFDTERNPPRHSDVSANDGGDWTPAKGEFLVRLRLFRHPARGVITADVTDLANPNGEDRICPLIAVKTLSVTAKARTPAGTAVTLEARSGATPRPDTTWTGWASAAQVQPRRFVQWRAVLETADPSGTPALESVALAAGVAVGADPARQGLVLKEFRNQKIVRGSHPFIWQPPSEKLTRLRTQWKLDEVIAAGQTELERFILLRNWVRRQWPHNEGNAWRPWDAINILSAPAGDHGMCVHYGVVFTQCALALGFNARQLILRNHYVADIWSNDHGKWVLMDVEAVQAEGWNRHGTALYWDRARDVPMSSVEIHRVAVVEKRPEAIIQKLAMTDGKGGHDAVDRTLAAADYVNFERMATLVRNNYLDQSEPWEQQHGVDYFRSDEYLWWLDGALPISGQFTRHTNRAGDFLWTVNQAAIALTATDSPDRIAVTLDTVTPNFKAFLYRINDGEWQVLAGRSPAEDTNSSQAALSWPLRAGQNTFEVKPGNAFDRDGIVSRVVVASERRTE
jgi:hypothetical protein